MTRICDALLSAEEYYQASPQIKCSMHSLRSLVFQAPKMKFGHISHEIYVAALSQSNARYFCVTDNEL